MADEDITEEHYNILRGAINSIPAHNLLIGVGDFNARIGKEDGKFTFHEETNRNGEYMTDLAYEKDLIVTNTYFHKKKGKLWTYISPGGNKLQLDYILVRKKWRNSVLNTEAYNTFASVGSDHRIVSARIRLSLRKSKTLPRKKQYDWKAITTDKDLQAKFSIEVHNRFQPLQKEEETATEKYTRFIEATQNAAEKLLPVRKKEIRTCFSNDARVIAARKSIDEAYAKYQLESDEVNSRIYKEAKKSLGDTYEQVSEENLTSKLKEVETAHINSKHGKSWKLINEISGRLTTRKGQIKGSTQKERLNSWYTHFNNLLGRPPDITTETEDEAISPVLSNLNIKEGPFDLEEYEKAKKALVEGKSNGEDGITPEMLKRCNMDDIILDFCNDALMNGNKPEQWSILNIYRQFQSQGISI